MSDQLILEILSDPIWLLPEVSNGEPFAGEHRTWEIQEVVGNDLRWWEGQAFPAYRVRMRMTVKPAEEGSAFIAGCAIARDISRFYAYITGRILGDPGDVLSLNINPPAGWGSNGAKIVPQGDWGILHSVNTFPDFRVVPTYPLQAVIAAVENADQLDEVSWTLIHYHLSALSSRDNDVRHFLLAKALEIARELIPGQDDEKKEAGLPSNVRARLNKTFHWLYDISNNRRETRHSITKRPALRLHPQLEPEEELDFLSDADTLLRYMASQLLGVPFVYIEGGRTIVTV
jgi:hypothetical protein